MSELNADDRRWLDALRAADEPTTSDRERVRALVLASTTAAAAGIGAGVAAKSVWSAAWLKLGLGVAIATTLLGSTVYVVMRPAVQEQPAGPQAPVGAHAEPPQAQAPPTPTPTLGMPEPVTQAPTAEITTAETTTPTALHAAPRAPARAADDLEGELALLAKAQRALAARQPHAALDALALHAKTYPRGALSSEREGLRAIATCEAGPGGATRASKFLQAQPRSPLAQRVRSACGLP